MAEEQHSGATTEAHGGAAPHADPSALGLDATMWVALAMLVVIGLAIWKKVPAMITGSLDKRIAEIRAQLDAATKLRAEAESLKAEYEAKSKAAIADAEAMRVHARTEADAIVAKAEADATSLISRRQKMAEDKIAAAERSAVSEVRMRAAAAAATAATNLIAENHDAKADKSLIDGAISRLN
jgi:F-type H+-transporting ATPase subunit b